MLYVRAAWILTNGTTLKPGLVIITSADNNITPNFAWIENIWVYGKLVCIYYYSGYCLTQYFIDTNRYIYM